MARVSDRELDASNLLCPMPVIRTQDAMRDMSPSQRLTVRFTDPGALNDIPTWCRINGHRVIETCEDEAGWCMIVEKGAE